MIGVLRLNGICLALLTDSFESFPTFRSCLERRCDWKLFKVELWLAGPARHRIFISRPQSNHAAQSALFCQTHSGIRLCRWPSDLGPKLSAMPPIFEQLRWVPTAFVAHIVFLKEPQGSGIAIKLGARPIRMKLRRDCVLLCLRQLPFPSCLSSG